MSDSLREAWRGFGAWIERIRAAGAEPDPEAEARAAAAATMRAAERLRAIAWPGGLRDALDRLSAGGARAYLVGGAVRDALLGRPENGPWDVATSLSPTEVAARFPRVVPIGIAHGTVLVPADGVELEVTTMRREGAYGDARHPDQVTFTDDACADLDRRDLTVNAMGFDPGSGELLDPHGGALDLERRLLRAVGDPERRFHEDALRPLRVARLMAVLEFDVAAATADAMGRVRERAALVAMERVRDEWSRMLRARQPSLGIELLRRAGLLELWAPEIAACAGVPQNRWHAYDVYEHSLRTLDAAPADRPRVRWAALLHDIGKPSTRVVRHGDGTFYGHAEVGAELADGLLRRFRFPTAERLAIVHLVREHMFDFRREWTDAALRRWLRRVGVEAVADLFDLRLADVVGTGRSAGFPTALDELRTRIDRLLESEQALSERDLAVDGRDVMRVLGIPPGPEVGAVLHELLELVTDAPARNTRESLLGWLESRAGRSDAG